MSVKTYSRHNCDRTHRTHKTMAKCIWRRAEWIEGTGPYATVAYCRNTTVQLHSSEKQARTALDFINRVGCGGFCEKRHDVVRLELPGRIKR